MVHIRNVPRSALSRKSRYVLLVLSIMVSFTARAENQEPIVRIETGAHTARTVGAAVDANGRVLVTAGEDKTARIWSLPDLRPMGVLRPQIGPGQDGLLFAVAVSPDGRLAAVAGALGRPGAEKLVLLFDLRSREVVHAWAAPPNGTYSLAFSDDGTKLAAGFGGAHGITVWSVANGMEILRDSNYAGVVYGLTFAPDGRLATASFDRFLRLYGASGKLLREVNSGGGPEPFHAEFSPDGSKLAVGFLGRVAQVRDGRSLALTGNPAAYVVRGAITSALLRDPPGEVPFSTTRSMGEVAWSRDGKLLLAGDAWNRANTATFFWPTVTLSPHEVGPRGFIDVGFPDDLARVFPLADRSIVTTSKTGGIAVIGPDGLRRASVVPIAADLADDGGDGLMVSNDGKRVAWSQRRAANGVWNIADVNGFGLADTDPFPLGLLGPGRMRIDASSDPAQPTLTIRAAPNNIEHLVLALQSGERALSAALRDDRVLVGTDRLLRLYDITGNSIWDRYVPGMASRVNIASGGKVAVAALGDGTVRWYRLQDGQELLALFFTRDAKRWVAFTPSGYYDASPGGEDLIGWHVNRGRDRAADFFPASQFRERMWRPDVVRLVLDTLDEDAALRQADAAKSPTEP